MAEQFTTDWARPTLTQAAWFAAIQHLATPTFAAALSTTDPRRVPSTKRTGTAQPIELSPSSSAPTRVVCSVPTDHGVVHVTVENGTGRWLVSGILPASAQPD